MIRLTKQTAQKIKDKLREGKRQNFSLVSNVTQQVHAFVTPTAEHEFPIYLGKLSYFNPQSMAWEDQAEDIYIINSVYGAELQTDRPIIGTLQGMKDGKLFWVAQENCCEYVPVSSSFTSSSSFGSSSFGSSSSHPPSPFDCPTCDPNPWAFEIDLSGITLNAVNGNYLVHEADFNEHWTVVETEAGCQYDTYKTIIDDRRAEIFITPLTPGYVEMQIYMQNGTGTNSQDYLIYRTAGPIVDDDCSDFTLDFISRTTPFENWFASYPSSITITGSF